MKSERECRDEVERRMAAGDYIGMTRAYKEMKAARKAA